MTKMGIETTARGVARRTFVRVAFAASAVLALGTLPTPASAADPAAGPAGVNAEIMILHATNTPEGSIDARIGALPQLRKPPFSAYNTYKLLDRKTVVLKKGEPATDPLVNGRTLEVRFVEMSKDRRYRIATHIPGNGKEGKDFHAEVTASPQEPFFVAGQNYERGVLVIGITIRP